MEIIKPQNEFITIQKHVEYLNMLKKCIENSINKIYVVSKSLHKKKDVISSAIGNKKIDEQQALKKITDSINFYSTKTAV
jgi:cell fate (sporulation/competence/biofilm development) regulator YmcA (YheA/YmcA/DUF963 family)